MKTEYDKKSDSKYVRLKKGKIVHTKKELDWLLFDCAKNGDVLGIEILNASKNLVNISVRKQKLFGYSISKLTNNTHDNEVLGLTIESPEYKENSQFALATNG